jgi:hypothetical protein
MGDLAKFSGYFVLEEILNGKQILGRGQILDFGGFWTD